VIIIQAQILIQQLIIDYLISVVLPQLLRCLILLEQWLLRLPLFPPEQIHFFKYPLSMFRRCPVKRCTRIREAFHWFIFIPLLKAYCVPVKYN